MSASKIWTASEEPVPSKSDDRKTLEDLAEKMRQLHGDDASFLPAFRGDLKALHVQTLLGNLNGHLGDADTCKAVGTEANGLFRYKDLLTNAANELGINLEALHGRLKADKVQGAG